MSRCENSFALALTAFVSIVVCPIRRNTYLSTWSISSLGSMAVTTMWSTSPGHATDAMPTRAPNLSGIDPQTGQVVELFHPRRSSWTEHFLLDEAIIVGRSPIGRTTVRLLQMNARRRVELRIELIENGEFD